MPLDVKAVRRQFPIISDDIAYLDNAATSQKPQAVLDRMDNFYKRENANINRGIHALGERATVAYGNARKAVQRFINAAKPHEILFTRNTTEAINLVAKTFGRDLPSRSSVALTVFEHHSNIVPWLQLKAEKGLKIRWIDIAPNGLPDEASLNAVLAKKPALLGISGISNVLGLKVDLKEIIAHAHACGAKVLVDAAQMVAHETVDVQTLDCDFLAFSGHKMYGPTGIGVLFGKEELLKSIPTFLGGGDMIQTVTTEGFTPAELPRKFEAGTPAIAESVGLHAAIDWIGTTGIENIAQHEKNLLNHALQKLSAIKKLTILGRGDPEKIASCISFTVQDVHPHDLTQLLSDRGLYLRAGHHCTQPLHKKLGITASARLSVAAYNTTDEIDRCIIAITEAIAHFTKS